MSQENRELVQRCFELFRRGEYAATLVYFDQAVETVEPGDMPGAATYVGYAGLAEAFSHFADAWAAYTVDLDELLDVGDQVLASVRYHAIGQENGVPVETTVAHVYAVENGRIVRWQMFNTRDDALEAAGLWE